jgi:S-adenosylmethionine decarboxylase
MKDTSRLGAIAKADIRPLANGFETARRHAVRANPYASLPAPANDGRLDHFVERDGMRFAGTHLIVDLWHAAHLDDLDHVEQALRQAAERAGATLLNVDLHHFSPNGGISGVAVLAESHISIHTWPELSYAAVDVFMCGAAQPHQAIEVLRGAFLPGLVTVAEHKRGVIL